MYVEVYPPDIGFTGPGQLVRVPIFVTHDQNEPSDSLVCFIIPLIHTHTNPTKYCSISAYWNKWVYSGPELNRSIFRHLNDNVHNRFLDLDDPSGWYGIIDFWFGPSFAIAWLRYYPERSPAWWEGSRVLFATITIRVQDTMTICLDTCFWPPSDRLSIAREGAVYIPRHNLPYCFSIGFRVGDVTKDGRIDVADIIYLINYLYLGGPAPNPGNLGDTNCDGITDIADVVLLINYLFRGGPAPACQKNLEGSFKNILWVPFTLRSSALLPLTSLRDVERSHTARGVRKSIPAKSQIWCVSWFIKPLLFQKRGFFLDKRKYTP